MTSYLTTDRVDFISRIKIAPVGENELFQTLSFVAQTPYEILLFIDQWPGRHMLLPFDLDHLRLIHGNKSISGYSVAWGVAELILKINNLKNTARVLQSKRFGRRYWHLLVEESADLLTDYTLYVDRHFGLITRIKPPMQRDRTHIWKNESLLELLDLEEFKTKYHVQSIKFDESRLTVNVEYNGINFNLVSDYPKAEGLTISREGRLSVVHLSNYTTVPQALGAIKRFLR